jgi:hypothetical protein
MLFEEFTDPILPERKNDDREDDRIGYADPELARTLDRVATHYPYYRRGVEGFMKYAQRAIRHSEETDQEHSARIVELSAEIEELKSLIAKLHQR